MLNKVCIGCNEEFLTYTREGRRNFSAHIKLCTLYQDAKAAKTAKKPEESDDEKRAVFLGILDTEFTGDQKESILKAMEYWLEG